MTIKALYPTTRPTLDLNFAAAKRLDPRITYTRASTGTFVGSNGLIQSAAVNQARFEHNPLTGESLGLLVEDARTNLVRYSQDMTDVTWSKTNLTVTKETIAGPAGTIGYDKVTLGTFTATAAQLRMSITLTPGTLCSNSIYVKQGTCRYVYLVQQFTNSGGTGAYFDLQTGTFLTGGGLTASSTTIQALANGWYRIQLTVTDVGPGGSAGFLLIPMTIPNPAINNSGGRQYNGNGEFIYAYGAQIEAGSFPTSYIPTVVSAVTRATDVASITGANFSSWFNRDNGTLLCNAQNLNADPNPPLILTATPFYQSAGGYKLGLAGFWSTISQLNTDAWANGVGLGGSVMNVSETQAASATIRHSFAYSPTECRACVKQTLGTVGGSQCFQAAQGLDKLLFQQYFYPQSSRINRLTFYPVRLPDAQLQALTAT